VRARQTRHTILCLWWGLVLLAPGRTACGDGDPRDDAAAGLQKALEFYAERQYHGGWASHYSLDLTRQWGEWRPTHANVVTINDSGTTGIGLIFLKAAQVLNEPRWLRIACKTGDLLVAGQLPNGGFTQELQITATTVKGVHQLSPYPKPPRPASQGVLENNTTDRAIELLLGLFDATGEPRYREAARRAVDFLTAAQYPCGAFPQRYPPSDGYDKYYTLNDGATTDSILRLISFYRRTGRTRYLDAARKGGDWLLSAVLADPTPGWAEQYDHSNKPAPARSFEPPGVGTEVTCMAIEALTELYLATGDAKYLAPTEKAVAWLKCAQIDPGGRCYRLYETTSGRPIFAERKSGRVYYDIEELPADQRNRWYCGPFFRERPAGPVSALENWQRLKASGRQGLLAQRVERTGRPDVESGYGAFRTPAIETAEDRLALAQEVKAILARQSAPGWWKGQCDGTPTISSSAFTRNTIRLLTCLQVSVGDRHSSR
jgi:hypothetical protein